MMYYKHYFPFTNQIKFKHIYFVITAFLDNYLMPIYLKILK